MSIPDVYAQYLGVTNTSVEDAPLSASQIDDHNTRDLIRYLHTNPDINIIDEDLDNLIYGISCTDSELALGETISDKELEHRYGEEQTWFPGAASIWTPYNTVRSIVYALEPGEQDVIYDLGSGYGRAVLYAGSTTVASCRGIELFGERVSLARQAQESLGLENVEFTEGNVLEQDYSDGNIFYMFLPFSVETYNRVILQLESIARHKPIRIIARGGIDRFRESLWLRESETLNAKSPTSSGMYSFDTTVLFEST